MGKRKKDDTPSERISQLLPGMEWLAKYGDNQAFYAHIPDDILKHGFMHNFVLYLSGDVTIDEC